MKKVILVGGGYSVKEGVSLGLWEKIKGQEIWSLNYAFMTMPFLPNKEIWVDYPFFENNIQVLQKLSEQGVKMIASSNNKYKFISAIKLYTSTREKYFGKEAVSRNEIYYGRMGLVGLFALSLAIAEGFEEIYLLGYDFGSIKGKGDLNTHYYQDILNIYSTGVRNPEVYRMPDNAVRIEVEDFKVYLQDKDVTIWNVSLNSNIPYFPKLSWEEFFKKL